MIVRRVDDVHICQTVIIVLYHMVEREKEMVCVGDALDYLSKQNSQECIYHICG